MIEAWCKSAELTLGIIADALELVRQAIIPPIPPPEGLEKMRALQIGAIVVIVILGLWLNTAFAGQQKIDALPLVLMTLLYFTVLSWIVAAVRYAWKSETDGNLIGTSLSLVIGFSVVAIFIMAVIRQIEVFWPVPVESSEAIRIGSAGIATGAAAIITIVRSVAFARKTEKPFSLPMVLSITVVLMAGAGVYLYAIA